MITTNGNQPTAKAEPKKLNQVTTASMPKAEPKPEGWRPKGSDLSKMITTHDGPKAAAGLPKCKVVIDESAGPGEAAWMDKQFKADAAEAPKVKKGGRQKKAE